MTIRSWMTIFFACCLTLIQAQSSQDILMSVGNTQVTVGEFKYIYEKNNGDKADYSKQSIDEYLDLYTKFKLKVEKAKDMGLDTVEQLQQELEGYRKQLAQSFLFDKEVTNKLIDEIYERKQQDVRARHILVGLSPKATDLQKVKAKKQIENYIQQIEEGKSFEELAKTYSDDKNTRTKGGDLGFVTAVLPSGFYDLETALYTLDTNEISKPIASKLGYHLVQVLERRPARGKIEVAHLFMKGDQESGGYQVAKKRMDSIYVALENGADFNEMVMKYSQDNTTRNKGGVLPVFGIAFYDKVFEDTAFGLTKDGDISKPIYTSAGFHILKRISRPGIESRDEIEKAYKERIRRFERYEMAQDNLIEEIKTSANFKERKSLLDQFIEDLDVSFYAFNWKPKPNTSNELLMSLGHANRYTVMDFALFAKRNTRLRSIYEKTEPLDQAVYALYDAFVKEKALNYAEMSLENKYPEFKSLMREYEEGILLFEATKINVWDKANNDTLGLYQFYEQNKSAYMFNEQAVIEKYTLFTTNPKEIKKVKKCAKKRGLERTLKEFNKKDEKALVEASTVTVEPGSKELIGLEFKKKFISEPIINEKNNITSFKRVAEILPARRKSLKEARGYVVADYQEHLEKEWIKELKKTYDVMINDAVYNQLIKE